MGRLVNTIFLDKDDVHRMIHEFLKILPKMEDDDVLTVTQDINDIECKITLVVPK